jgi:5'-3' exonuclease
MARILHIVDVSSAVYAGSFNTHAFISGPIVNTVTGYRERIIPMGGVSQLFNIVYKQLDTGTIVFCCDRPPTVKRGMDQNYKTTRTKNERANLEKEIAEYVLNDCGFNVIAEEGYEADDLVYTCVKLFKNQYDHVYIYTGDSDLYMLIDESVSVLPTHSKAKTVTLENFEYTAKKNQIVKYNTLTFQKVLDGDPSKAVSPLSKQTQMELVKIFAKEPFQSYMGDRDFMRSLVEMKMPEILPQFDIIYPLDAPMPTEFTEGWDKDRIKGWAGLMRHKHIPGKQMNMEACIEELIEKSLYV